MTVLSATCRRRAALSSKLPSGKVFCQQRGFTLLELLIVITIIAIGSAGVVFAFRDSDGSALDREADRISAILESSRAQSRSSGVAMVWLPLPEGFVVLPGQTLQQAQSRVATALANAPLTPWLAAGTNATTTNNQPIRLGPEPMLPAQAIVLNLGGRQLRIASDGLRPFRPVAAELQATVN